MSNPLKDRVIIVTGAAGGIGRLASTRLERLDGT
jgi:NAD(P)-dependent dehydrogenase (short-subunit alcohol dehydrogenase family)